MATKAQFNMGADGEILSNQAQRKEPSYKQEPKEPEFYVFQLISNEVDKYGNISYPETYSMSSSSILEDSNGNQRAAKYIDGVPTLWVDEQKDLPEGLKRKRAEIVFHHGILRIPSANKNLVQFMLSRPDCEQSKSGMKTRNKFRVLNFADIEKAQLLKTQQKHEAMKLALNAAGDKWLNHARFLGVKFNNQYGLPKTEDAIRKDYVELAERNSEKFMQTVSNPLVDAFYFATKALQKGKIDVGKVKNQATWSDSGNLLCTVSPQSTPAISIAEHFLTKRGEADYATIRGVVENG